jgi:hypothetical protein
MVKALILGLIFELFSFAGQSFQVKSVCTPGASGCPVVALPSSAPWTTMGASSSRWEMRLHNMSASFSLQLPPMELYISGGTQLLITQTHNPPAGDAVGTPFPFPGVIPWSGRTDVLIRLQRDVTNSRYTLELCDTVGGNCNSVTYPITALGQSSWAGWQNIVSSGYQMAFLRWFSTTVPVGTTITVPGSTGDLADWEFAGNLNDASGHSLNWTLPSSPVATTVGYSTTPSYNPSCSAGSYQVLPTSTLAQLDGSGSQPLDGGATLTYAWSQIAGSSVTLSSTTTVQPGFLAPGVFGPLDFQLIVTDGSSQSTTCTVNDGAVAPDSNGVVSTGNTSIDTLIGPQIMLGRNPWPWFDDRNKKLAGLQAAAMHTNFPAYWDVAAAGTVSVSPTATCGGSAAGACLTGVGTHFTGLAASAYIVVWWNGGANRRLNFLASVIDDTHAIMNYAWDTGTTETNVGYATPSNTVVGNWGIAQEGTPGNYYDNVESYYALYYRSGIDTYLNAARTLADRFWISPGMDQGMAFTSTSEFKFTGRSESLTGMILRALDSPPASMWPGLRMIWPFHIFNLGVFAPAGPYTTDQRGLAYDLLYISYCAMFDPDSTQKATCKTAISNSFAPVWTPYQRIDGSALSWPSFEFNMSAGSWVDSPVSSVTLTNGSTAVVGTNTHWTTITLNGSTPLWFLSNTSIPPRNNSTGDTVVYFAASVTDDTHLTLTTPYAGTSGSGLGWTADVAGYTIDGWGSQPFMEGIQTVAFIMAAKAIATSDPTNSALSYTYAIGLANWLKTYGYSDPAHGGVGGMSYFAQFANCAYPVQTVACTQGMTASQVRTDAAETVRGMGLVYAHTQDATLKTFIDTVYTQMYSKPGTSSSFPGDGSYISDLDDGQTFMSSAPLANKWLGFFFGFDNGAAWPAYRLQ